LVSNL